MAYKNNNKNNKKNKNKNKNKNMKKKKETRQGGTDIFSTVSNNNLFIVPFIFPVVCPPSLFHSKGRADANNTCKKATILIAMQQKLQTRDFSTITLCQSTNARKQRRATWNALRGEALRPPRAPPPAFFYGWPPAATSCSDSKTAASLTSIIIVAFSRQPTENT